MDVDHVGLTPVGQTVQADAINADRDTISVMHQNTLRRAKNLLSDGRGSRTAP